MSALVIWEIQVKFTIYLLERLTVNWLTIPSTGKDGEEPEFSHTCDGDIQRHEHFERLAIPLKLKYTLRRSISINSYHPREMNTEI